MKPGELVFLKVALYPSAIIGGYSYTQTEHQREMAHQAVNDNNCCKHCRTRSRADGGVESLSMGWRLCHSWVQLSKSLLQQEQQCFFQPDGKWRGRFDISWRVCLRDGLLRNQLHLCLCLIWRGNHKKTVFDLLSDILKQILPGFVILPVSSLFHFSVQVSEGPRGGGEASCR